MAAWLRSRAMSHLEGRTVVITGAGGGFGRLLAARAAARGASIGACDLDGDALDALAAELAGPVETGVVDVTDLAAMRGFVDAVVDRFGAVDVMVNNAGTMPLGFYADHEAAADAWHRCIDINIKGVLNGIIAVHDHMLDQGRGHVVNLSSIYGNQPVAGAAVYGASKAAVTFLSEALRQESTGRIKVTTVRPTGVPGTGLADSIVNPGAINGILGANAERFAEKFMAVVGEDPPAELTDEASIQLAAMTPELLADQIVYAIDQPWGVSISDLTVRASGEDYVL